MERPEPMPEELLEATAHAMPEMDTCRKRKAPSSVVAVDGLNLALSDRNVSGYMYVFPINGKGWQAKPSINGTQRNLGSFEHAIDAAKCVAQAFLDHDAGQLDLGHVKTPKKIRKDSKKKTRCARATLPRLAAASPSPKRGAVSSCEPSGQR